MIVGLPKTIEYYKKRKKTILELLDKSYCDTVIYVSLHDELEQCKKIIKELIKNGRRNNRSNKNQDV